MATDDTQLDALSFEIDGKVYSLKAPPPSCSKIVLKEAKHLEMDFDIHDLLQKRELIAGCIRLARYAVTGIEDAEIGKEVDQTLAKVAMALQESMNDMDRIAGTDLLSMFVDGVIFLFLGEESLAWDRFGTSRKGQELLMKMSGVRKDSLEQLDRSSCSKTLASLRIMKRAASLRIMKRASVEEAAEMNLRFAEWALSILHSVIVAHSNFWYCLNRSIESIEYCNALGRQKLWQEEDYKKRYMNSNTIKKQIVTYYAKWVALKDMCTFLHGGLQSVQEKVWLRLAARPRSVEEARKELPKMCEDMEEMLRKQRKDLEERMRMRFMEDHDDDF